MIVFLCQDNGVFFMNFIKSLIIYSKLASKLDLMGHRIGL